MKRGILLVAAIGILGGLWFGPLPELARASFAAHMTLHMGVVALAAPLLALALGGTSYDPVARWPRLFPPIPWSLFELAAVWLWHAPALHHHARGSAVGFAAEQLTFLVAGAAVWLSGFGGRSAAADRRGAGVAALLLTSMHMTLLGALLALSPRPLYVHAEICSLAPLDDQHLGGAIMILAGGVAYLAGGLWLTVGLLRPRRGKEVTA